MLFELGCLPFPFTAEEAALAVAAVPLTRLVFVAHVYLRLGRRLARPACRVDAVPTAVEFPLLCALSAPHKILSVRPAGYQLRSVDNFVALATLVV